MTGTGHDPSSGTRGLRVTPAPDIALDEALEGFRQAALGEVAALYGNIDRASLRQAVETLAAARRVYVTGTGIGRAFAHQLRGVAGQHTWRWHLVDAVAGRAPPGGTGELLRTDALVCVDLAPAAEARVRAAGRGGAPLIWITDHPPPSRAASPDETLLVLGGDSGPARSRAGTLAFLEMLVNLAAAARAARRSGTPGAFGAPAWPRPGAASLSARSGRRVPGRTCPPAVAQAPGSGPPAWADPFQPRRGRASKQDPHPDERADPPRYQVVGPSVPPPEPGTGRPATPLEMGKTTRFGPHRDGGLQASRRTHRPRGHWQARDCRAQVCGSARRALPPDSRQR
ncbi:MAG: hypothetical protein OXC11_02645 [Rhodospirillales bacterium]|nr:hypothetical protein [Rhodospirillales bacterium]